MPRRTIFTLFFIGLAVLFGVGIVVSQIFATETETVKIETNFDMGSTYKIINLPKPNVASTTYVATVGYVNDAISGAITPTVGYWTFSSTTGDIWNINAGNVGIGTTEPHQKFVVNDGEVGIGYNDTVQTAKLAVNGNVGIGTTTPSKELSVQGDAEITGALTAETLNVGEIVTSNIVGDDITANNQITAPIFYDSGGPPNSYYIDPSATTVSAVFAGNVGIGTTPTEAELVVNGNIYISDFDSNGSDNLAATVGYVKSRTGDNETDPVFGGSAAAGITSGDITNWDIAYGWGNHADVGYLTAETDPQVGVLQANKWCVSDGAEVNCDQNNPDTTVNGCSGCLDIGSEVTDPGGLADGDDDRQTLSDVLWWGNSAGSHDINMNGNDITGVNDIEVANIKSQSGDVIIHIGG